MRLICEFDVADEAGNKVFSVEKARHDYRAMKDNEDALYGFLCDLHTWVSCYLLN